MTNKVTVFVVAIRNAVRNWWRRPVVLTDCDWRRRAWWE